jgi:hypothetical protein
VELNRALIAYLDTTQDARAKAHETAESRLAAARRELDAQREAASRAEEEAREDARRALNAAEQLLSASRAELERVHKQQLDLRRQLLADRRSLQGQIESHRSERTRLQGELRNLATNPKATSDRAFRDISASLDVAEANTIALLYQQLIGRSLAVPEPPEALPAAVLELPSDFQARIQKLQEQRLALATEATLLGKERHHLRADQAEDWLTHTLALASLRERSLHHLGAQLKDRVFGLTAESLAEVQSEGAQLAIRTLHYFDHRSTQVKDLSGALSTLQSVFALAIGSIELLIFIAIVWWAMRRWKGWMRGVVSAMSRYVHIGGWPLIFARVADALQTCGPPLILAAAAVAVYRFLGATSAPPEIRIGFEIVFWTAVLRGQLRFLERFADNVAARREQAARDRREEATMNSDGESGDTPPAKPREHEAYTRAAKLFKRSWMVMTWFVGWFVIIIQLVHLGMGDGVVAHHLTSLAKITAVPLLVITVHWWRAIIVTAYTHRIDRHSKFGSFVIAHGSRWYGAVVALVAMPVLLFTRGATLTREHVANLDATRRLLAFLFRRQVERHAEKTGQASSADVALPEDLTELFPHGALTAEKAPLRAPTLDELEDKITAWLDNPVDGSAALVGGAGMGKSTILNFLSV